MAGKSDVQAGGAFVRLFLKDELTRNLKKTMDTAGKQMMLAGAAITGVLAAGVKHFADYGDQLDKMSKRTNVAASELARLKFAAEQSGTGIEAIERAMREMQTKGLDPSKFRETAAAIAAIQDPTKRAQVAMDTFGRRIGTQLLPMLKDVDKLAKEADLLGIVPSDEDVAKAADLTDAFNRMKQVIGSAFFNIGAMLADDIELAVGKVVEIAQGVSSWIRKNKELIGTIASIGAALLTTGTALIVLAKAIGVVGVAMALLAANPMVAILAILGAAVAFLAIQYVRAEMAAAKLVQTARKKTEAASDEYANTQKQNAADLERLNRLKELQAQQEKYGSLLPDQMTEAQASAEQLNGTYEGLNVTIDEQTGKVTGLAGAYETMAGQMKEVEKTQIQKQMQAISDELQTIADEQQRLADKRRSLFSDVVGWATGADAMEETAGEQRIRRQEELINRMRKLREQFHSESLDLGEDGDGAAGIDPETMDKQEALARRMQERLLQMELERIDNREKRELAALAQRHAKEIEEFRRLNQDATQLEEIYERQRFDVHQRYANQRGEEAKRRIEEERKAEERRVEDIAKVGEGFADRIARLQIESGGGSEDEKRKKLIEYEHQLELERIAAMEGITEAEKQNLQQQAANLRDLQVAGVKTQQATATKQMANISGMFRASAIAAAGRGSSPEQKNLEELKGIRKDTTAQRRLAQRQALAAERLNVALTHG